MKLGGLETSGIQSGVEFVELQGVLFQVSQDCIHNPHALVSCDHPTPCDIVDIGCDSIWGVVICEVIICCNIGYRIERVFLLPTIKHLM